MGRSFHRTLKSALWIYLVLSALVLCVYKFRIIHLTQHSFLIFVNANMLLSSALAIGCVAVVIRRLKFEGPEKEFWNILLVALCFLCGAELAAAVEEVVDAAAELYLPLSSFIGMLARLALIYLSMRVIVSSEVSTWIGWLQALLPWIFIISFSAFVLYYVVVPMHKQPEFGDEIGSIFMVFAGLIVVIFMTAALAGRRMGDPNKTLAYFWPLAGMVGYMVTDVMYYCHVAMHISSFVLWELGFVAGYVFTAYGALLMLDDERTTI